MQLRNVSRPGHTHESDSGFRKYQLIYSCIWCRHHLPYQSLGFLPETARCNCTRLLSVLRKPRNGDIDVVLAFARNAVDSYLPITQPLRPMTIEGHSVEVMS